MSTPEAALGSTPFPQESQAQTQPEATWNPWQGKPQPRWFAGLGFNEDTAYLGPLYRALEGAGQGAAKGEELLGGLWHAQYGLYAKALGNVPGVGPYLKDMADFSDTMRQDARERVKAMTPDATTVGSVGQTINGLASGLTRYSVGTLAGGPLGGAASVGGTEAADRLQALQEQGVTPGAAGASAAVTGVLAGAGALLPAGFGSSLVGKILTGAGSNAGFGLVSRYADHKVLELAGYPEMAAQQEVWDKTAMATDLILGGGFGVIAHLHGQQGASPEEAKARIAELETKVGRGVPGAEDAALTANLALRDRASAPGPAVDPQSAQAHQAALETATEQLLQGKPVDVSSTGITQANFAARPAEDRSPVQAMFVNALKDAGYLDEQRNLAALEESLGARLRGEPKAPIGETKPPISATASWEIPRNPKLSETDSAIEDRFAQSLQADYEGMKARYAALPDAGGGKILNTDTARELSPDYLADRTKSAAVHEPASSFVKRMYAEMLSEPPKEGEDPVVLFTAGGTGAGKSSAVKTVLGAEASRAQIIMDTNMNGTKSAIGKIDQALTAGKEVKIAYVHREPVEALKEGALTRAMKQEAKHGTGRTVPIEEHVNTHVGANNSVRDVAEHYAREPGVSMRIIDNTRGPGGAQLIDLEHLPRLDYNRTREETNAALEAAYAQGRISGKVYRGFSGRERPLAGVESGAAEPGAGGNAGAPGNAAGGLGTEPGRQPEPQRPGERSDLVGFKAFERPINPDPATRTDADRTLSTTAIGMYSTNGHYNMNSALRWPSAGGKPSWEAPATRAIDAAFKDPQQPERAVFEKPTTLYRGLGVRSAANLTELGVKGHFVGLAKALESGTLEPGTVLRDPAFMSTTRDRTEATLFAGDKPYATPVSLEITVPAGTPYLTAGANYLEGAATKREQEALLERGSGIKVSKVEEGVDEQGKKTFTIKGELVAPAAGKIETVATASGRQIQVEHKVIEAAAAVTSDNPAYPQELQPRQRGERVALQEQVRSIAQNLDPARLGSSAEADRGAPITGAGNVVESGNGRVMALRQVYAENPEKAQAYRDWLTSQGYDIAGIKEPVLVRERLTPMSLEERRAFTVEANQAATASFSPVERAQADARILDGSVLSQLRNGELATAQNAPFIRAFLSRLPETERNALVNPDGTVSQEGVRRLQAAILAKAYGGAAESNQTLGRMLESTDTDMRSTLGAMLDSAPAFARLRQAVEDGKIAPEYDLSRALTQAIETAAQVRERGQALGEYLKQGDFLQRRAPIVDALIRAMYDKTGERLAGRDKVAQTLMNYADRALKQRLDQSTLFGDAPLAPDQLLTAQAASTEAAKTDIKPAADMFGLRTAQGKPKPNAVIDVARQALERSPNLEIADANGEPQRGRAEFIQASENAQVSEERVPDALTIAANCFGQRSAA